jgi:hypothetical protein
MVHGYGYGIHDGFHTRGWDGMGYSRIRTYYTAHSRVHHTLKTAGTFYRHSIVEMTVTSIAPNDPWIEATLVSP